MNEIDIIFRPSTLNEEIEAVWQILKYYFWFEENGYSPSIPSHPNIEKYIQISLQTKNLPIQYKKEIKKIVKEIYNSDDYKNGMEVLSSFRIDIKSLLPKFIEYYNSWDFTLYNKYEVVLSLYGTGGSYDHRSGEIYLLCGQDGRFYYNPFETIIHEMVHIGIEHLIKKFKLTHNEKERIVDLFCSKEFKLKNYEMQDRGNSNIDSFILSNDFNLPLALRNYVKKYPR